ncbi:MAG: hypothetical protein ACM3SO_17735 [Betaproteobacteria bacterium]
MGSPLIGDAGILLIPPRHWVLGSGEAIATAARRNQTPKGQFSAEPIIPGDMLVYSRADLEEMRATMTSAGQAWQAFAKWLWPDLCPIKVPNPLTFLLGQETVMETVNGRRGKRGKGPYQGAE